MSTDVDTLFEHIMNTVFYITSQNVRGKHAAAGSYCMYIAMYLSNNANICVLAAKVNRDITGNICQQ